MSEQEFIDTRHVKNPDLLKHVKRVAEHGCPFCEDQLLMSFPDGPVEEVGHWVLTPVTPGYEYENAEHHLLLITREHLRDIRELDDEAWVDLLKLAKWACEEYGIPGGGFAFRFGDSNFSGAEIRHLHVHLIKPVRDEGEKFSRVVNFPIG